MSGDREARVLAAAESIEVEGKTYKLRPVVAQHLCDLEMDALRYFKRQYLRTFSENADLLKNGRADELIERKMTEVAGWDLGDLPQKTAYDVSRVPVTKHVKGWVAENLGDVPDTDAGVRALLATALDAGQLRPGQLKKLSGKPPLQGRVRYDQWWVTGSMNGMVAFIASSIRTDHPEVSREQVARWSFAEIAEAARKVEGVTSAAMGNT